MDAVDQQRTLPSPRYCLNGTIRIRAEPGLKLELDHAGRTFEQEVYSNDLLEPIYRLVESHGDGYIDRRLFASHGGQDTVMDLASAGILVPADDELVRSRRGVVPSGFLPSSLPLLKAGLASAKVDDRGNELVFDEVFAESVCLSIDLWVRRLPYHRLDRDRDNTSDLHWICPLIPSLHVRAVPFVRAIDDFLRERYLQSGSVVLRAHVYAGGPGDIYHVHQDSKDEGDLTAIYYPSRWCDSWGGELLFYESNEPHRAIAVRPGRLVVFHGHCPHRVGAISALAGNARYSIVLRYGRSVA